MAQPRLNPTRQDNFNSSHKRARGPSVYLNLLPLVPPPPSLLASFLSSLPFLSLSPPQIQAIYDDLTHTIRVTGEQDMTILWRSGFFGKGSLSRSEPAWKRRTENKRNDLAGGVKKLTSEEMTAQRRIERRTAKLTKKAERDLEKLQAATAFSERGSTIGGSSRSVTPDPVDAGEADADEEEEEAVLEKIEEEEGQGEEEEEDVAELDLEDPPPLWHLSAEHTQLQPEEAFFLLFALGSLSLRRSSPFLHPETPPSAPLSILATWKLFLLDAILPSPLSTTSPTSPDPRLSRFDSPFLINYAAYHHFRSMGWVVRSGIKFCVDWILYGQAGPVGSHAEFAVIVLPNYADPEDAKSNPFISPSQGAAEGQSKDSWRYFNTVSRVCAGVKKTPLLLQILVPPLKSLPHPNFIAENPAKALAMFEMREVTVRRWVAGRMRD